jgi:type IV secretion system protein VirB9
MVIGDSVAWEAEKNASGNRIFLKPKEDNAATNLTVLTSRRTYSFALQASRATSKDRMTWRLRFEYPEEEAERALAVEERASLARAAFVNPDAPSNPGKWNFEYSYGGGKKFVPVQLFDDGQFTYFKFKGLEELPAIFVVDEEKNESLVNSRVSGEYIVVHRIAKQFALRSGKTVTCIFNEHFDPKAATPVNAPRPVEGGPTPASESTAAAARIGK